MASYMVEYNILKRDAEANKTMYDGLLTKLKEADDRRRTQIFQHSLWSIPRWFRQHRRVRRKRAISRSRFLVGLVGGIGLALLREYLDNTVKTPDDVETLARLPSLAVVPAFTDENGTGKTSRLHGGISVNGHEKRIELVAQHLPKSQMSEAFRALRTSLLLSQADHPPQVILVTSALPREGKTTAAANLAVTLAQLGDRTLLIDADLRKPGVRRALNMADGKYAGLSSYLAGVCTLDLVTVPHPAIPNLVAIPTGPLPPNPADLLSSHKLADAIAELRSQYKFIVIDSPPIMAATDAVILSVQADGVSAGGAQRRDSEGSLHAHARPADQRQMPAAGRGVERRGFQRARLLLLVSLLSVFLWLWAAGSSRDIYSAETDESNRRANICGRRFASL